MFYLVHSEFHLRFKEIRTAEHMKKRGGSLFPLRMTSIILLQLQLGGCVRADSFIPGMPSKRPGRATLVAA